MTDNASEFRSAEFEAAVDRLQARHLFIRAGRRQSNGVVERILRTILEECWEPAFARYLIPKCTGAPAGPERYLRYYNSDCGPILDATVWKAPISRPMSSGRSSGRRRSSVSAFRWRESRPESRQAKN